MFSAPKETPSEESGLSGGFPTSGNGFARVQNGFPTSGNGRKRTFRRFYLYIMPRTGLEKYFYFCAGLCKQYLI